MGSMTIRSIKGCKRREMSCPDADKYRACKMLKKLLEARDGAGENSWEQNE